MGRRETKGERVREQQARRKKQIRNIEGDNLKTLKTLPTLCGISIDAASDL